MDKNIVEIDKTIDFLNPEVLNTIRSDVKAGKLVILRGALETEWCKKVVNYLSVIGSSSLPNYSPIVPDALNFHRVNNFDQRSHVKGCFHQFVFYPWNQDILNLFGHLKKIYELKNLVSNIPADKYLYDDKNYTARIAAQFYPAGKGFLKLHRDPVFEHQLCIPTVTLSKKGTDYNNGGAVFITKKNKKINIDDISQVGDVTLFDASLVHGVEPIDPDLDLDWLNFKGRWMLLLAVNKFVHTNAPDSFEEIT